SPSVPCDNYVTVVWSDRHITYALPSVERLLGTNVIVVHGDPDVSLPVTVHEPGLYAGHVLAGLCRPGVPVYRAPSPSSPALLWTHDSAPLSELVSHMLKTSDNLYAEQLLRTLGQGTVEAGLQKEAQILPQGYVHRIVDGSGLSRYDLITPRELAEVLRLHYQGDLENALPEAGMDGTLALRFQGTALDGRLWAKTGSLSDTSSLAGRMHLPDGRTVICVWMCNAATESVKGFEDKLFLRIYASLTAPGAALP
ncbi:MAG TPA: D-alanyl-D-alanine carboxypeptidase, partial [Candidatus Xenobia bacterium]